MNDVDDTINDYDDIGLTPLLDATFAGDPDSVRRLLEEGADPNKPQRDEETATPLWHARR